MMGSYDPKDPSDDTSELKRMSEVGWMCDTVWPTSVEEENENGGWIRTAMPAGNATGNAEAMFTNPGRIQTSGNRAASDEPRGGKSVNRLMGNTGEPGNHDGEYTDMDGPKPGSRGGY